REALGVLRDGMVALRVCVGHVRPLVVRLVVGVLVRGMGLVLVRGWALVAGAVGLGRAAGTGHVCLRAAARPCGDARPGESVADGVGGVRGLRIGGRDRVRLAARILLLARDHSALLADLQFLVGDVAVGVDVVLGEVVGGLLPAGGELGQAQAAIAIDVQLLHLGGAAGLVRIVGGGVA